MTWREVTDVRTAGFSGTSPAEVVPSLAGGTPYDYAVRIGVRIADTVRMWTFRTRILVSFQVGQNTAWWCTRDGWLDMTAAPADSGNAIPVDKWFAKAIAVGLAALETVRGDLALARGDLALARHSLRNLQRGPVSEVEFAELGRAHARIAEQRSEIDRLQRAHQSPAADAAPDWDDFTSQVIAELGRTHARLAEQRLEVERLQRAHQSPAADAAPDWDDFTSQVVAELGRTHARLVEQRLEVERLHRAPQWLAAYAAPDWDDFTRQVMDILSGVRQHEITLGEARRAMRLLMETVLESVHGR